MGNLPNSRAFGALLSALPLFGLGCAGGLEGSVFRGDGYGFRIADVPAGWSRLDVTDAALAYDTGSGYALVNARCDKDGEDVSLRALTQHLFLRFTERVTLTETLTPFDEREALHSEVLAKLDGVPQRFSVWVMKKDGCVYDLLFFSPRTEDVAKAAEFDRWALGFKTEEREVLR